MDEVGRGPLAGPVTAAAVILNPANIPQGLADSKTLSAARRQAVGAEGCTAVTAQHQHRAAACGMAGLEIGAGIGNQHGVRAGGAQPRERVDERGHRMLEARWCIGRWHEDDRVDMTARGLDLVEDTTVHGVEAGHVSRAARERAAVGHHRDPPAAMYEPSDRGRAARQRLPALGARAASVGVACDHAVTIDDQEFHVAKCSGHAASFDRSATRFMRR